MSREDEAFELGRIAWVQVERVLGIADPRLLSDLSSGGTFWVDDRTAPPLVGFDFEHADTVLYFDFGTRTIAQVRGDGRERAWDAEGRPVMILDAPPSADHAGLN